MKNAAAAEEANSVRLKDFSKFMQLDHVRTEM